MQESTAIVATTANVSTAAATWVSRATASTAACGAVAAAIGWWLYSKLITNPLHIFYSKSVIGWGNIPQHHICARMMGNKPEFSPALYDSCDYMREQCRLMIEREFESWDATIMVVLYATVLSFIVLQLLCHCCLIRPLVNAFRDVPRRQRRRIYKEEDEYCDDDLEDLAPPVRRRAASTSSAAAAREPRPGG